MTAAQRDDTTGSALNAREQAIAQRLIAEVDRFNSATTGIKDARDLLATETDGSGRLLGGVYGWSWGGTCWIQALWVRDDTREVVGRLPDYPAGHDHLLMRKRLDRSCPPHRRPAR